MVLTISEKRNQVLNMMGQHAHQFDEQILQDADLCDGLTFADSKCAERPTKIVLTGATGFLGGQILRELATHQNTQVTCITRGKSKVEVKAKVKAALRLKPGQDMFDRIRVVNHDLCVDPVETPELIAACETAEAVIHCAARVNFTDRYPQARAANVIALKHLLSLFNNGQHIHHVSTAAVFSSDAYGDQTIEETTPPRLGRFFAAHGYCQSKLVGEFILHKCRKRGINASVYRPGVIGWDTRSGYLNESDFLTHFIAGSVRVGALPDIALGVSIAPVDYVAKAITDSVLSPSSDLSALHFCGEEPISISDLAQHLGEAGAKMTLISYTDWIARIDADVENPLRPLALLLPSDYPSDPGMRTPSLLDGLASRKEGGFSDRHTTAFLKSRGMTLRRNDALSFPMFLKALSNGI